MASEEVFSEEQQRRGIESVIKNGLKPGGKLGENVARLVQGHMRGGFFFSMVGPLLQSTMLYTTRVNLKLYLKITCARDTVKVLAFGIPKLDGDDLVKAIMGAIYYSLVMILSATGTRNSPSSSPFTT